MKVSTCYNLAAIFNPCNPRLSGGYCSRVDPSVCACVVRQLLLFDLLLELLVLTARKRSRRLVLVVVRCSCFSLFHSIWKSCLKTYWETANCNNCFPGITRISDKIFRSCWKLKHNIGYMRRLTVGHLITRRNTLVCKHPLFRKVRHSAEENNEDFKRTGVCNMRNFKGPEQPMRPGSLISVLVNIHRLYRI